MDYLHLQYWIRPQPEYWVMIYHWSVRFFMEKIEFGRLKSPCTNMQRMMVHLLTIIFVPGLHTVLANGTSWPLSFSFASKIYLSIFLQTFIPGSLLPSSICLMFDSSQRILLAACSCECPKIWRAWRSLLPKDASLPIGGTYPKNWIIFLASRAWGSYLLSSQPVTVSVDTLKSLATSGWDKPLSSRAALKWSPRVFKEVG